MIVVDTSVWIDNLKGEITPQTQLLATIQPDSIIAGDVVVAEVLRGLDSEREAVVLQRKFEAYGIMPMLNPRLAVIAAAYYRALRRRGVTIRTFADLVIATFCIEEGHHLLHHDRDFDHFERHLDLKVLHPA